MADVEIVGPLTLAKVEEKSGQKKDGKGEWHLWKAWFVGQPGDKGASTSFSSTAGKVLAELFEKKTPAIYHLKEDKEFQGRMEYTIEKIVSATDQKTVLYEPEGGGGGGNKKYTPRGGPPDWSMRTPEERLEERCSIEAQKALEYAIRTLEATLPYENMTADDAVAFVKATHTEYTALIRSAVSRSAGSGSRSSGAGGSSTSSGPKVSKLTRPGATPAAAPEATSSASEADAEGSASFRQGAVSEGHPSPESALVDAAIMEILTELTGSESKTKLAFKKHFDLPATAENMTAERLDELVGTLQHA